jgi:hypothetical protein
VPCSQLKVDGHFGEERNLCLCGRKVSQGEAGDKRLHKEESAPAVLHSTSDAGVLLLEAVQVNGRSADREHVHTEGTSVGAPLAHNVRPLYALYNL